LDNSEISAPFVNDDSLEVLGNSSFTGTSAANDGVISGTGNLSVSGTAFTNPGVLSPGGMAIGQLTLLGNLTQAATSAIDLQFGGTQAAPNFDQLAISGTANFDGTDLNTFPFQTDGYVPADDDVLVIITCGSACSGTFDTATVDVGGVTMTITVSGNTVELRGPGA
jgi:hypothetical protein